MCATCSGDCLILCEEPTDMCLRTQVHETPIQIEPKSEKELTCLGPEAIFAPTMPNDESSE